MHIIQVMVLTYIFENFHVTNIILFLSEITQPFLGILYVKASKNIFNALKKLHSCLCSPLSSHLILCPYTTDLLLPHRHHLFINACKIQLYDRTIKISVARNINCRSMPTSVEFIL